MGCGLKWLKFLKFSEDEAQYGDSFCSYDIWYCSEDG